MNIQSIIAAIVLAVLCIVVIAFIVRKRQTLFSCSGCTGDCSKCTGKSNLTTPKS